MLLPVAHINNIDDVFSSYGQSKEWSRKREGVRSNTSGRPPCCTTRTYTFNWITIL